MSILFHNCIVMVVNKFNSMGLHSTYVTRLRSPFTYNAMQRCCTNDVTLEIQIHSMLPAHCEVPRLRTSVHVPVGRCRLLVLRLQTDNGMSNCLFRSHGGHQSSMSNALFWMGPVVARARPWPWAWIPQSWRQMPHQFRPPCVSISAIPSCFSILYWPSVIWDTSAWVVSW